jgi:hypothetical protein
MTSVYVDILPMGDFANGLDDLMQLYIKFGFPNIYKYVCGRGLKHLCLKKKGDMPN